MNILPFQKITDFLWEIPKNFRSDMRVPARVYATATMLKEMEKDKSLDQLINIATLPGIVKFALAMPDAHEGYGFPIGGVAAMDIDEGVISPGGIGYDINCGVRLLKSSITQSEVEPYLESLAREIFHQVPSGVGRGGKLKLDHHQMKKVLHEGMRWMIRNGYTEDMDQKFIESEGYLDNADPDQVSEHAIKRGMDQLGTIGGGNHFVEMDYVETIYDSQIASNFGLFPNQIVFLLHTGSRGLGHQVATDHLRIMTQAMLRYHIKLPDYELACVPFSSVEGQSYFDAMAAAANFAWCNRQMITYEIRQGWQNELGKMGGNLEILYDVAHNMAKIEKHNVQGAQKELLVHRKGATRSFPPQSLEIPQEYKNSGQPVLIPGSMGTSSYVLAGTEKSMKETFGSSCHGAGRKLSRHAALKIKGGRELYDELQAEGIRIQTAGIRGLPEEAPFAYKDVDEVCGVVENAGIAKKVARLKPLIVVKG